VMTKTFLGLTVACARCHDHKFDAIASRDYYGLAGFLESSSLRDVRYEWQEQNCRIVDRMRAMDEAARPAILAALAEALRPALDRAADYLMAARDLMRPGAADASELSSRMDAAATAGRLDRGLLLRWVEEIQRAAEQPLDPLHPWAVLAQDRGPEDPARLARLLGPVLEAWQADATRGRVLSAQLGRGTRNRGGASVLPAVDSPPGALPVPSPGEGAGQVHAAADAPAGGAETTSHASLVVDYARLAPQDWLTDGLAFGYRPTHAGQVLLGTSADRPVTVLCDEAVAHSGTVSTALPGMLRTPTFTIRAPAVWSRVSGSGQAFLVVDSHRMIAGPLHGGTKKAVKAGDAWSWLAHDTRDYIGQRAHIEFTAGDPNGFIAVAAVLQSETAPPAPAESSALVRATLSDPAAQSAQEIARRYERVLLEALDRLAHDRLAEGPDAAERARVAGWLVERCHRLGDSAALHARLDSLMERYAHDRAGLVAELHPSATALAMLDANGVDEHVLIRGNPKNRGEAVPRRYLEAIGGVASAPAGHGSGRLELARHMTDPGDPLVARVIVNRIWHHLFGRGIVASVDNFGALGQPPTHPELLDHLAARFVADGWSIKKMVRAIVLSSVYQQSSAGDAMAAAAVTSATAGTAKQTRVEPGSSAPAADPQNLLLQHMPIRRLEGEAIRDAIVAISGRLDRTMYGPGVEVHLTPFMEGRGRPHESGPLDGAGRRSIYIRVRRNFLAPMMLAFDTPIPFNTVGRRSVSNVPAQALILLNDPLAIEQARVWARGVLAAPGLTPPERITRMYLAAYARPPRASELADALAFLEHQGRELGVPPGAWSDDARVWADLAHVLFNVKEFIFIR
jgi:hypothetical protein